MDTITTTNDTPITVDQVEALVARLETEELVRREKLLRLIRAFARIIALREPAAFKRRVTLITDEAGHWDSSRPPEPAKVKGGPRTICVRPREVEEVPTSSGAFYTWERVTVDPGVYVDAEGRFWGGDEHGTGRVGRYAAYPGDCDRAIEVEWALRTNVDTADLEAAEETLRPLAFPASAKA